MKKIYLLLLLIIAASTEPIRADDDFYAQLADSVLAIVNPYIVYDPAYVRLDYPNGDVPANRGVCTDVVIRAYRKMGIDLQKEVHEDMRKHFDKYPKIWRAKAPDRHIDHRRVPNLMTFFSRHGTTLTKSEDPKDYQPGDIVCWRLSNGMTHIGIVSNVQTKNKKRYKIVHNIGRGQVLEDCLFSFKIIGHYRYKKG